MSDIAELAKNVVARCVPSAVIDDDDRAVIRENAEFLLGLEEPLVKLFYDTLYAHGPTAAVFEEGERPAREQTLRDWWRRTVTSNLDDSYLEWMAFVGIVHIRRKVANPMMLSMFSVVTNAVHSAAVAQLDPAVAERLRVAFSHLAATASALISEGYSQGYINALQSIAGLDPKLVARLLDIEISNVEAKARAALG